MSSAREARIYRVNAWREVKGRPALTFAELEPERIIPGGPEWWTEENTAAWHKRVWGEQVDNSEAQRGWSGKITQASGRGGALTYKVITAKEMAAWRATDPRPSAPTYYDGTPIVHVPFTAPARKPSRKRVA